jgi:hypothetical protein
MEAGQVYRLGFSRCTARNVVTCRSNRSLCGESSVYTGASGPGPIATRRVQSIVDKFVVDLSCGKRNRMPSCLSASARQDEAALFRKECAEGLRSRFCIDGNDGKALPSARPPSQKRDDDDKLTTGDPFHAAASWRATRMAEGSPLCCVSRG